MISKKELNCIRLIPKLDSVSSVMAILYGEQTSSKLPMNKVLNTVKESGFLLWNDGLNEREIPIGMWVVQVEGDDIFILSDEDFQEMREGIESSNRESLDFLMDSISNITAKLVPFKEYMSAREDFINFLEEDYLLCRKKFKKAPFFLKNYRYFKLIDSITLLREARRDFRELESLFPFK